MIPFINILRLSIHTFEELSLPMSVTAYDILRCKTRIIRTGRLSRAIAASCCVPVMFQPVLVDSFPHYDGGIFDRAGVYERCL